MWLVLSDEMHLPTYEVGKEARMILKADKFFNCQAGLLNNRAQSTFRDIFSGMIRDYGPSTGIRVIPDFVASFSMPVKYKTGFAQFMDNFAGIQGRQNTHISKGTGIRVLNLAERA